MEDSASLMGVNFVITIFDCLFFCICCLGSCRFLVFKVIFPVNDYCCAFDIRSYRLFSVARTISTVLLHC